MADFTIADVLAWARTKPADEEYNFVCAGVCALGQYAQARGMSEDDAACELYRGRFERRDFMQLRDAANGISLDGGCTFGGFVKRLEALLPKSEWLTPETYLAADCGQVPA